MRTGNLGSLSARDHAGIRERLEFERAEQEAQRLAEDQTEYKKYSQIVEDDQRRVPPALRIEALDFESWRRHAPQEESNPVLRGQVATNRALLSKLQNAEREGVVARRPDPEWETPESAKKLKMKVSAVKEYVKKQSELFVSQHPEYSATPKNLDTILDYLEINNVRLPNSECFARAFERLRSLGLIEDRLEPEPIQQPSPEPDQQAVQPEGEPKEELVDGWDIATGQPRKYTQREVWLLSSEDMKRAFRMWADRDGDRRPKFTRGYYG